MQAIDVRTLRTSLGESQSAFAERFGVDQSAVSRWEKDGLPNRGAARRAVEKLAAKITGPN
jgi:DNA-binding transcriptional regulator YiaG